MTLTTESRASRGRPVRFVRSFGFGRALLIFFLLGLSAAAWSAGKSLQYEVEVEVSWVGRDGKYVDGGARTSSFLIAVDDAQWYIKLIPSNWPVRVRFDKKVPELLSCEMSSDGR